MPAARFSKSGIVAAFAFAIGLVVGTAGEEPLRVLVNGEEVQGKVRWRLVDGEVVGPVAPVASALGADQVRWRDDIGALSIRRDTSPWTEVDREPRGGGRPYAFTPLGPILTLRHRLSEVQWNSLNQPPDSAEPVLARFEIIDALSLAMYPYPTDETPTKRMGQDGFQLTAILYWVTLDGSRGYPRGASRIMSPLPLPPGAVERSPELQEIEQWLRERMEDLLRRHRDVARTKRLTVQAEDLDRALWYGSEAGLGRSSGISQWGPWPRELTMETVEYVLKPDGITEPREVEGNYGPLKEVVQGTSGWLLDETRTRQVSSETITIGDWNHVVPLYDISVQKFPAEPPPPPADPMLLPWSNTHCRW